MRQEHTVPTPDYTLSWLQPDAVTSQYGKRLKANSEWDKLKAKYGHDTGLTQEGMMSPSWRRWNMTFHRPTKEGKDIGEGEEHVEESEMWNTASMWKKLRHFSEPKHHALEREGQGVKL